MSEAKMYNKYRVTPYEAMNMASTGRKEEEERL